MDKNVPPLCHPKIASGIQRKSCVWLTCEGCRRVFSILGGPGSFLVSSWLLFSLMAFSGEAEAVYTWSDISWLDQSSEHSPMNWLGSPVASYDKHLTQGWAHIKCSISVSYCNYFHYESLGTKYANKQEENYAREGRVRLGMRWRRRHCP